VTVGELLGAGAELGDPIVLDEVCGHQDRGWRRALPEPTRRGELGERRMEVARRLIRTTMIGGAGKQIFAPGPLAWMDVGLGAVPRKGAYAELHVSTHTVERTQQLGVPLVEDRRQALLALELGPEAQRQHRTARHDRLDYSLVRQDELGRRSRTQRAMATVDGREPFALQPSEGCPAQSAARRRGRGSGWFTDAVGIDHRASPVAGSRVGTEPSTRRRLR
jgi:hypothetical protein